MLFFQELLPILRLVGLKSSLDWDGVIRLAESIEAHVMDDKVYWRDRGTIISRSIHIPHRRIIIPYRLIIISYGLIIISYGRIIIPYRLIIIPYRLIIS